ncbi:MAG: DUF4174 domain-containing protein [bacterium TMED46]|nr:MAG: DUF4174 domain-containing protein [bacterium TMED46]|tara:strand:- start:726 stop:1142 length:417 start_codon:yes stop_codon:yes gene_type:complete
MLSKIILMLIMNVVSIDRIDHISDFKWNNRLLVIINDGKIDVEKKISRYKTEFLERDMVIVEVDEKNVFIDHKKMSKRFSRSLFKTIRKANSEDHLLLIGKDGEIKNSYPFEIDLNIIFSDVDRMPMRKYEMVKKNKK